MLQIHPRPQTDFDRLVRDLRPRLYTFCARMVGSVVEGEDVVQETLLKALQAWPGIERLESPEAWMFRIARNAALDALKRGGRTEPLDDHEHLAVETTDALSQRELAEFGLRPFMKLSAAQRACLILMDVLGYTLAEIAAMLDMSVPAVKAALHRGRAKLRALAATLEEPVLLTLSAEERAHLARYVALFNARDFDAVRALLADDVRLDLMGEFTRHGRAGVEPYFGNYSRLLGWHLVPGTIDGQPGLLSYRDGAIANFIFISWRDGRITRIRDFFHCPVARGIADARPLEMASFPEGGAIQI
ncbi:sigma-70 family RNA polymerase sigma factor [Nitrospirillum sp. BR 11163]|uniref:sigma-70 family RNA polymerase sigma factor n=1 Tax=Nitrospirillum sp. BR 11163 TaxID=3104323 RepID=UPI002AFFE9FD|nr:sigma-70 family RNA polymerase sigma factor [Nitrospirillum sp. BR 11163]MEA1674800.1 sigma-70 family RNA polymerase sigma factor [Nitrospirillum sp. BR 11163]